MPVNLILGLILGLALLTMIACSKEVKPSYTNAKDSFEQASKLIEAKKYDDARPLLTEVINRDSSKVYAPQAQLKLAESYVKEGEPDLAIEEFRKFVKLYPESKYAPTAQYQVATLLFGQIEGPDRGYRSAELAIKEFDKLNEMFPRNPYRDVISLRLQKCRNILAEHEFYVGNFYFKKGAYKAAIERFEVIYSKYPDYTDMPKAYYYSAMSYKELKTKDKALEYMQKASDTAKEEKLSKKIKKELELLKR